MKRWKKIMAVVSIVAFVFGSFISTVSASSGQTGEEVETKGAGVDPICAAMPTGGKVNDGRVGDHRYFNTPTQISANWGDFITSGEECEITGYEYQIREFETGNTIVPWDPTTAVLFTEDLAVGILTEGNKYITDVKAVNFAGKSEVVSSLGQILDITPPITNYLALQQNKPYGGGINLIWVPATELNVIASYQIYRDGALLISVNGDVTSFADTISGDNVNFSYFIKAVDKAGNVSEASNIQNVTVDDVAPAAPSISYWIGGGNIVIFWPQVGGALTYEIYRNGTLIYSGPDIKYTDLHPAKGQTHSYEVYALDEAGNKSLTSNTLSIYIPKPAVSSITTTGEIQGTSTGTTETTEQVSPSPSPSPSGEVKASESSQPEETAETKKTNWSLIIAIIIAAAIVVAGVLYWWYAREEDDEI